MGIFSAGSASVNIVPDFSGAQKAIGRWASGRDIHVTVKPDLDNVAMAKTDAEIERPRKMHVEVDVDKHDLIAAADFLTGFSTVGKVLQGLFSPKVLGLTDAVGAAGALGAAISQVAGAAFLLPAGIAAMAAPLAVVTLGVQGMGTAFKAIASGDVAKTQKALANLAPSARDFVLQMHALAPAFKDLRLDVQGTLFDGLGKSVSNLAKQYLPTLHSGLGEIAFDLNGMAKEFVGAFAAPSSLVQVHTILTNIANTFLKLKDAVKPFVQALLTITSVGSGFLPGMAAGLAKMAQSFNTWVSGAAKSGELANIIQVALDRIKQLIQIIVAAGKVVFDVFGPAIQAGATLLDTIQKLLGGLDTVLKTNVAQSSLKTFFESIAKAAQTLLPGIEAIVQALVVDFLPIAGKLASSLAPLVNSILIQFADLLDKIAPVIYPALVNAITAWLSAIAPLVPLIGNIITTLLPPLTKILQALVPIISAVVSQFGDFLAKVLQEVAPLLPILANAFIAILKAIEPLLPPILNLITVLLPPLIKILGAIIPVIVLVVQAIAPFISQMVTLLTPAIKALADIVAWAFQVIIGPVITYVVNNIVKPLLQTIVAGFQTVGAVTKATWETIILPTWNALRDTALFLWHNVAEPAFRGMQAAWNWLGGEIGRIYHGFIEPIWTFLTNALTTVQKGFQTAITGIQAIWHGLIHALEQPVQLAIDWVWNKTLRNAWNLLNNLWGGTDLPPVVLPGMDAAEGAVLPGYTPGVDVHHFYSPTGGRLNLSGGEAVMVPEWTDAVGADTVHTMNRLARAGGATAVRAMLGLSFAGGGVVPVGGGGWPGADFGGHIGVTDRSTSWLSSLLGLESRLAVFLPAGGLMKPVLDYLAAEKTWTGDQGSTNWATVLGSIVRSGSNQLWDYIKGQISNLAKKAVQGFTDANATVNAVPASRAANEAAVAAVAASYGWGPGSTEWQSLVNVIMRESGFNNVAQNPTSTAYGMFQFLNSTWASYGIGKTSDPSLQALAGLKYIQQRYGNPSSAWAHELNYGWYDNGGHLPPGWSMTYNGTGSYETILNSREKDVIASMLTGASGGSQRAGGAPLIGSATFTQSNAAEVVDELVHRVRVMSRGGAYAIPAFLGVGD